MKVVRKEYSEKSWAKTYPEVKHLENVLLLRASSQAELFRFLQQLNRIYSVRKHANIMIITSRDCAFLPVMVSFAPSLANRTAVPRPIPFDEPASYPLTPLLETPCPGTNCEPPRLKNGDHIFDGKLLKFIGKKRVLWSFSAL